MADARRTSRDLMRNNLKRLRQERGAAASVIARILGVETNHVYRIERGETRLLPENIDLICEAFNIEPSYFLIDHDETDSHNNEQIPIEIYNELLRIKDLSPEGKNSVINFIKFQISEMEQHQEKKA